MDKGLFYSLSPHRRHPTHTCCPVLSLTHTRMHTEGRNSPWSVEAAPNFREAGDEPAAAGSAPRGGTRKCVCMCVYVCKMMNRVGVRLH